jgi:hypothetical protein
MSTLTWGGADGKGKRTPQYLLSSSTCRVRHELHLGGVVHCWVDAEDRPHFEFGRHLYSITT